MGDIVGYFLEAPHQGLDALEHGVEVIGEAVELVAGAGDRQTSGEIAAHDGLRRIGHGVDALEHAAADEESAGKPKHDDQRQRPLPGMGDDAEQALAFLEIASDQKMKAAGQLDDPDQGAMIAAFRGFEPPIIGFQPAGMIEHAGLERADIAGKPLPGRRRHQIKARARAPRAQIDDDHQPPDAALLVLFGQSVDFAVDGRGDLLVDQASRIEREIAEQRRREQNEYRQIDQRQLERRGAQKFAERGHCVVLSPQRPVRRRKNHLPRIRARARLPASRLRRLGAPQLDAADLAGDRLRQFGKFEPPHALERRERGAAMAKDRQRRIAIGLLAGRQRQKRLRHGKPQRIGRRHHGGLGHRRMLDQDALKLERADAIIGGFEHVVGAADIGQIAVVVDCGDVAGAIDAARAAARTLPSSP